MSKTRRQSLVMNAPPALLEAYRLNPVVHRAVNEWVVRGSGDLEDLMARVILLLAVDNQKLASQLFDFAAAEIPAVVKL